MLTGFAFYIRIICVSRNPYALYSAPQICKRRVSILAVSKEISMATGIPYANPFSLYL